MTRDIALFGGSGFIGRRLLLALAQAPQTRIRALMHEHAFSEGLTASNIITESGDLLKPDSLSALITSGCTIVNLAYLSTSSSEENLAAARNLARACRIGKAARVVHVSTATVVGAVPEDAITESILPNPRTEYELTKLQVEQYLAEEARNAFELVILRPTAVFGPGGKNLARLAASQLMSAPVLNYLRSCVHGRRRMNLVCVDNVVAAIQFAINAKGSDGAETFIVSDDDDELNNYQDVESALRARLGCGEYVVSPFALPRTLLKVMLVLRGRSNTNPNRIYSSTKLSSAGFTRATALAAGLASFADWYRQAHALSTGITE